MSGRTASRLPKFKVSSRPAPQTFDHCLRYWVWSRTRPGVKYLVQLDSYNFNGICQCEAFQFNLAALLRRGITPAAAVDQGLVKMKERQRPEDALRCPHIVDAFMQFAEDTARIIHENEANPNQTDQL